MRTPLALLAALGAAMALLATPAAAQNPQGLTCADVALRCPDLRMRVPYNLYAARTPGGRTLLHAANAILSAGRGPVSLRARRPAGARTMSVSQRIYTTSGTFITLPTPAGAVVFKHIPGQGGYWKFANAARFELRTLGARRARRCSAGAARTATGARSAWGRPSAGRTSTPRPTTRTTWT